MVKISRINLSVSAFFVLILRGGAKALWFEGVKSVCETFVPFVFAVNAGPIRLKVSSTYLLR